MQGDRRRNEWHRKWNLLQIVRNNHCICRTLQGLAGDFSTRKTVEAVAAAGLTGI